MIRVIGKRGCGKTTKLIQKAIEDDAILVVPTFGHRDNVLHLSEKLGCKDKIKCITFWQFLDTRYPRSNSNNGIYYIDELDLCLSQIGVSGYSNQEEIR